MYSVFSWLAGPSGHWERRLIVALLIGNILLWVPRLVDVMH
jgi:hypothetical protein